MVLLTVTSASKAAIEEYRKQQNISGGVKVAGVEAKLERLSKAELGSPIDHNDLIEISTFLSRRALQEDGTALGKEWRLDALLRGANVYQAPPPTKPEPTPEYKALMRRLRAEEEQRQYERMVNPPARSETFGQRFHNTGYAFDPATSIGQGAGADEVDDVTYADINRQVGLIINVLLSIIACGVAIWVAARRWEVPQRLGLSMSGSGLVAVAEVAIYMGYIRRIKEAKTKEQKKLETKEVVETWVLDGGASNEKTSANETIRYRKGKHR